MRTFQLRNSFLLLVADLDAGIAAGFATEDDIEFSAVGFVGDDAVVVAVGVEGGTAGFRQGYFGYYLFYVCCIYCSMYWKEIKGLKSRLRFEGIRQNFFQIFTVIAQSWYFMLPTQFPFIFQP